MNRNICGSPGTEASHHFTNTMIGAALSAKPGCLENRVIWGSLSD